MTLDSLAHRRREILEAAARHGARNVRVFGSVARGDDRPDSDIDLLVVEDGRTLLDVIALEQDLQELLGQRVDSRLAASAHTSNVGSWSKRRRCERRSRLSRTYP